MDTSSSIITSCCFIHEKNNWTGWHNLYVNKAILLSKNSWVSLKCNAVSWCCEYSPENQMCIHLQLNWVQYWSTNPPVIFCCNWPQLLIQGQGSTGQWMRHPTQSLQSRRATWECKCVNVPVDKTKQIKRKKIHTLVAGTLSFHFVYKSIWYLLREVHFHHSEVQTDG